MASAWTTESDAELKRHIEAGSTYREIASAMGMSRSAIGGRAARLGLKSLNLSGNAPKERRPPVPRTPRPQFVERITQIGLAQLRCVEVEPLHLTLDELERCNCRFPLGDAAPFSFCGHPALAGRPYCGSHTARCVKVSEY
jgi:GcrA cell cycle regulator